MDDPFYRTMGQSIDFWDIRYIFRNEFHFSYNFKTFGNTGTRFINNFAKGLEYNNYHNSRYAKNIIINRLKELTMCFEGALVNFLLIIKKTSLY